MEPKPTVYKVEGLQIGDKTQTNRIVFASVPELERACKDLDNGRNIYVQEPNGMVTKILHQMVSSRVYEGTLLLSASGGEATTKGA